MILQILLYLSLCAAAFGKDVRIVGGKPGSARDFPFMASLRIAGQNEHICAGSIITNRHILSVAHCIYGRESFFHLVRVYVGLNNIVESTGTEYKVERVYVHPQFSGILPNSERLHNDIAIYLIEGTIQFNRYIKKIDLPTEQVWCNSKVVLAGWGTTSFPSSELPHQIQKLSAKVVEYDKCLSILHLPFIEDIICTYKEGTGVCTGDSGGPVTQSGKIVGIISFSQPCAQGVPDLHTNVYRHLDFIRPIINQHV